MSENAQVPNRSRVGFVALLPWGRWLVVVLGSVLALVWCQPPAVVPTSAARTEFSADRAAQHVSVLATKPRPLGSPAHAAAREYLKAQLELLGLEVTVQTAVAVSPIPRIGDHAARVNNLVARLRGTQSTGAILLVAHYDSARTGPGAADNAAAVAAVLEAVRATRAAGTLQNDIVVLFSDAEELGLIGAQAFAEQHPWMSDVALVLNFEARGSSGPVMLFRTSAPTNRLVQLAASRATRVLTTSLMDEVFRRLPNNTDLTVFGERGIPGFDFAFIGEWERYHTANDNIAGLNPGSLQHQGRYLMDFLGAFGSAELTRSKQPVDALVYFSVPGRMVVFDQGLNRYCCLAAVVAFFGTLVLALRRKLVSLRGFGKAVGVLVLMFATGELMVAGALALLERVATPALILPQGGTQSFGFFSLGAVAAAAFGFYLWRILFRSVTCIEIHLVTAVGWLFGAVAAWFAFPAAAYLFSLPCLAAGLGLLIALPAEAGGRRATGYWGWALFGLPALLLHLPMIFVVSQALGVPGLPLIVFLTASLLAFLAPLLGEGSRPSLWIGGVAAAIVMLAGFGYAWDGQRNRARFDNLFYVAEPATRSARWISFDKNLDEWTSRFIDPKGKPGAVRPYLADDRPYWNQPAPYFARDPVAIEVLDDLATGEIRRVRLRLQSSAAAIELRRNLDTRIDRIRIDGHEIHRPDANWERLFYFDGPANQSIVVELETPAGSRVRLQTVAMYEGLPGGEVPAGPPIILRSDATSYYDLATHVVSSFEVAPPGKRAGAGPEVRSGDANSSSLVQDGLPNDNRNQL